jgi:hypothetical protein
VKNRIVISRDTAVIGVQLAFSTHLQGFNDKMTAALGNAVKVVTGEIGCEVMVDARTHACMHTHTHIPSSTFTYSHVVLTSHPIAAEIKQTLQAVNTAPFLEQIDVVRNSTDVLDVSAYEGRFDDIEANTDALGLETIRSK